MRKAGFKAATDRHDLAYNIVMGKEGGTKSTMGFRNFDLRRNQGYKQEEEWWEPVRNIHTPFSPHCHPFLLFASFQLGSQKKTILR